MLVVVDFNPLFHHHRVEAPEMVKQTRLRAVSARSFVQVYLFEHLDSSRSVRVTNMSSIDGRMMSISSITMPEESASLEISEVVTVCGTRIITDRPETLMSDT